MGKTEKLPREKFSRFCAGGVLVLELCFMAAAFAASLLSTCTVTTGSGEGEILSFVRDNVLINLLFSLAALLLLYFLLRVLENVPMRIILPVLMLWTLAFSAVFVCSGKLQPSQDAYIISFFAREGAKGDYSYYHEYFRFFPYQLGFALYEELFFRFFNLFLPAAPEGFSSLALQVLNGVYTSVTFLALVKISGIVFGSTRVQKLTAVLLFFPVQPIFFASFMYGNTPALCFAMLAVWMFLGYIESDKTKYALLCTLFISAAAVVKLNTLIFVAAISIVWGIFIIRRPTLRSVLLLALMIASVLLFKALPQKYYEARMGEKLGSGIPQSGWLAMGLNEGQSGPGWYDPTYTATAFIESGYDPELSGNISEAAISERLAEFSQKPGEALRFFGDKFLSQWNEPSFESLWINQVNRSYSSSGKIYDFFCESHCKETYAYMNIIQQLVFGASTFALVLLLKKRDILTAMLPLVVLGAMLYHLMFEAKSQYALGYFLLMIPTAAYGIERLFSMTVDRKEPKK